MDDKHTSEKEPLQKVTTYWSENPANIREQYYVNKDNRKEGEYISYHVDGKVYEKKCNYKNGILEGKWEGYKRSQTRPDIKYYKNGILDGLETENYRNNSYDVTEHKNGVRVRVVSLVDENKNECVLGEGEILVYKATKAYDIYTNTYKNCYVKILVPAEAKRVTPFDEKFTYKGRVEYGKVIEIFDNAGRQYNEAESFVYRGNKTVYVVNKVVLPDNYDPNPEHDCGAGINVHRNLYHCDQWFNND
jgi:antitoxin component YwqK of YwqJK toxin-antitoxin module